MKKNLPIVKLLLLPILVISIFFLGSNAYAQDSGMQLRVSPPVLELTIEPGSSYSDFIKFTNLNEFEKITLYPQILSFKALGEDGGQEFIEDSEENKTYSLAQWVKIAVKSLEIEPLESVVLPFTVTVPLDAEPGGRYAAILLSNQPVDPADAGNVVALGAKSGSIMLLRVAGETVESALIKEFKSGKNLYGYLPVDFKILVENNGNIHVKPLGKIEIVNIFGKTVDEIAVNEAGGNVLPESSRKFESKWEREKFTLGRYSAVLTLNYGENSDKYMSDKLIFWVLPVKEIVIGVGVILLLIAIITVVVKSYKKQILKKAMEMQKEMPTQNPPASPV
ncbi:MAG: hypothetical protein ACOX0X_00625 [Candidatus Dojkabacteria bacterium]|jgi:hypothetical protein